MRTRTRVRRGESKGQTTLVTEVTSEGRLIGATVWSRSRQEGVFVEASDFEHVRSRFNVLSKHLRKQEP